MPTDADLGADVDVDFDPAAPPPAFAQLPLALRVHYAAECASDNLRRLRRVLDGEPPLAQAVTAVQQFVDRVRDLLPLLRDLEGLLPASYRYDGGALDGYDRSAAGEMVRHCLNALAALQHHAAPDCDDDPIRFNP